MSSGRLRQAARKLADSTVAAAQPLRWAVQVKTTTNRQTTGLVEVERVGTGVGFWAQVRNSVYLADNDLIWVVKDPSAQGNWIFDGFVKGAGTGESLNNSPIPSVQTPIVTSPDGTPLIIRPIAGQQGTIGRAGETINFAGAINVAEGITFAALGAGIVQSSAGGVLSSDYTIDDTTTWATGKHILPTDAAGQDLGDATHRWDLFGAVADISVENIAAGGGNSLQAFIHQIDGTGMTGTLRGAYITASGGNTANTGTIRGAEIKARAGRPGETGNDVNVLEGFSVSSDAKTYDVTVHRGGEIILDGGAGTSTLAVGLRIANNFQADRATTSYGLQIYRDSFDYTADIQLSSGGTIGGSSGDFRIDTNGVITPGQEINAATAGESVLILQTTDDDPTNPALEVQSSLGVVLASIGAGDSTTFLEINQADATNLITVDTVNRRIGLGAPSLGFLVDIFGGGAFSFRVYDDAIIRPTFTTYDNRGHWRPIIDFQKARGDHLNEAAVANGDYIGDFIFRAYDGTSWEEVGGFGVKMDGAVAAGQVPTHMFFRTRAAGDPTLPTERMRLTPTGNLLVGSTTIAARLGVQPTAALVGQIIRGAAAQSVNLQEWQDSNTAVLAYVNQTGGALFSDKVSFTQVDGDEFIDSLADGYMDYRATTAHRFGDGTNQLLISGAGVVTLEGTAKRWLAVRPDLDYTVITAQGKPTQVTVGVFHGYSMPIYVGGQNEELFFNLNIPGRWDEASDIIVHLLVALSGAEDVNDNFNFQLSWEHLTETDVVPVTSHDVEVEQAVLAARNAQYSTYELQFTLDYDVDDPDDVADHDDLSMRLRRIDATNPDVTNEIIVLDYHVEFQVNKMFDAEAA